VSLKKYVPRSIQNIFNRLEAFNESLTEKLFSEELAKTFEVVVYCSKNPETTTPTSEDPADLSPDVANYNFFKARSLAGHHDLLVAPENARFVDEYERLRNLHFQAILKKSSGITLPQTGDVWLATQVGGNMVSLISFERSGDPNKFKIPEGDGPAQAAHTNGTSPTTTVGAASAGTATGANGQYSQDIQDELNKGCKKPKVFAINSGAFDFITKIKASPSFKGWSGPALAGVVANAQGESNYVQSAKGDKAKNYGGANVSAKRKEEVKKRKIKVDGTYYCSWGYWQFNICPESAAGSQLAKEAGINVATPTGKADWLNKLKDDEFQFAFAAKEMAKITSKTGTDPYVAGSDIVLEFEKPACMNIHALERGNLAVLIYNKYKATLDAP
jgi:hypothetical protein